MGLFLSGLCHRLRVPFDRRHDQRLREGLDLLADLRGALRYFGRNRVFVATAVLVLALGIGGATAVFSVSETLLLRPLSYRDGERLVAIRSYRPLDDFPFTRAAGGTIVDWQQQATSFDAVAGYRWGTLDVIDGLRSHRLSGLAATPEFFDVFGVALNGRARRGAMGVRGAGRHGRARVQPHHSGERVVRTALLAATEPARQAYRVDDRDPGLVDDGGRRRLAMSATPASKRRRPRRSTCRRGSTRKRRSRWSREPSTIRSTKRRRCWRAFAMSTRTPSSRTSGRWTT